MSFWVRKKETIPTFKTQCNLKLRRLAQRRIATSLAGFFLAHFGFIPWWNTECASSLKTHPERLWLCMFSDVYQFFSDSCVFFTLHFKEKNSFKLYGLVSDPFFKYVLCVFYIMSLKISKWVPSTRSCR